MPISVTVESDPACELMSVSATNVFGTPIGLCICYPHFLEIVFIEIEWIDPCVTYKMVSIAASINLRSLFNAQLTNE